jgi:hypothetical protein
VLLSLLGVDSGMGWKGACMPSSQCHPRCLDAESPPPLPHPLQTPPTWRAPSAPSPPAVCAWPPPPPPPA